ncbi:MAG: transglycosylase SLT domain-containing protein [Deferribacterales bacterium]
MSYILRRIFLIFLVFFFETNDIIGENYLDELKEFEKYKSRVDLEFRRYKTIIEEEYSRFKKEIYQEWGDYLTSDQKRWVEYSKDLKVRKVIDFEKNEMLIQIKSKDKNKDKEIFKNVITDTLREDFNTAFIRDKVAQSIESKVRPITNNVKNSTLPKDKIIGDIVVQDNDINKGAQILLKGGEINYHKNKKGEDVATLKIKLNISDRDKAIKFKPYVDKYSNKYNLPPELVYAIIHTESYFNPMATSPAPAYGLMQIMPTNAGKDAAVVLFGSPIILLPSFLYNPENNVNVGTTYFNLLIEKYLAGVKDIRSRFYLSIVGYNVGLRNVLRLFSSDGDIKNAVNKINQLSSDEIYDIITKRLPQKGGADYLIKVNMRMEFYKDL